MEWHQGLRINDSADVEDVAYQHLRVIGAGKRRTSYPAMEEAAFWDRVGREGAKL